MFWKDPNKKYTHQTYHISASWCVKWKFSGSSACFRCVLCEIPWHKMCLQDFPSKKMRRVAAHLQSELDEWKICMISIPAAPRNIFGRSKYARWIPSIPVWRSASQHCQPCYILQMSPKSEVRAPFFLRAAGFFFKITTANCVICNLEKCCNLIRFGQ